MFRKTRRRLVFLNAAVFLLILSVLGALLYAHMRHRLVHETDEALNEAKQRVLSGQGLAETLRPDEEPDSGEHENLAYLLWDAQGRLIGQSPKSAFDGRTAERFRNGGMSGTRTVQAGGLSYRVLNVSVEDRNPEGVAQIAIVMGMKETDNTLRLLFRDILGGLVAGGVISVAAGMFLAERALIPIRRSWDKQQRFVADASHEFRTPTAIIHAQTELLLQHPEHSIERESARIAVILKESRRLGKLVDDLLTLARSDSNQALIRPALLSLDVLLAEVTEPFRVLAETKGIEIVTEIDHPLSMWGDEARIRQLLVIVLDNALQYTPQSGRIRVSGRYASSHAVSIAVADTGSGIAEGDLPHVFERFYRGDKARTRAQGGTGLGLSIAKWIAEAHGGTIRIHSKVNEGTMVELTFPRQPKAGGLNRPTITH